MAVEASSQPGQLPSSPVVQNRVLETNHRTARLVAIIAGLLGAVTGVGHPVPARQADDRRS